MVRVRSCPAKVAPPSMPRRAGTVTCPARAHTRAGPVHALPHLHSHSLVARAPVQAVWPEHPHTAGVSLLLRDDAVTTSASSSAATPVHYAFIGTSDDAGPLFAGTSTDLLTWSVNNTPWVQGRPYDSWDLRGLAAGPTPVRLSDGNYLYLYSIDNEWSCHSASCNRERHSQPRAWTCCVPVHPAPSRAPSWAQSSATTD